MIHEMKLNDRAMDNISIGIKKFELRLFDEKRAKINLNDYIIFKSLSESSRTLKVKVLGFCIIIVLKICLMTSIIIYAVLQIV